MAHDSDFVDIDERDEPSFANIGMEFELLSAAARRSESEPGALVGMFPVWFSDPFFAEIARGMVAMAQRGERVEPEALFAAIGKRASTKLERCFVGRRPIATLGEFARVLRTHPAGASFEHYAGEAQANWMRREAKVIAGHANGGSASQGVVEAFAEMEALRASPAAQPVGPGRARINCTDEETFAGLKPPDYLVSGLIQRGFLYGLTGMSGIGKTNVAMRIAVSITQGQPIGPHEVTEPGPVLYLIAENPDDWRYRLKGIKAHDELAETGVRNVLGPSNLSDAFALAAAHIREHGPVRAIIVDTSVAHMLVGADENDNPTMLAHAKALRHMTELEGRPAVIVVCHPPKNGVTDASMLIPRGGYAFFAELDGNFTLWGSGDEPMELHFNKMRGPMFAPIMFEHVTFYCPEVVDARGVQQSCVMARVMSPGAQAAREARRSQDQEELLLAVLDGCDSGPKVATRCGWCSLATGEPDRKKVARIVCELHGLVEIVRNRYVLKPKGKMEAERIIATRGATTPRAYKDN